MNTFFTGLAKSMNEGQIIDMRIAKTGENLTFFVTTKGKKNLNGNGSPEDVDAELLSLITAIPESKKGLTATLTEPEEEEDGNDDKKESAPPAGSEKGRELSKAKKEASKPAKKEKVKAYSKTEETKSELEETKAEEVVEVKVPEVKTEKSNIAEFRSLMEEGKNLMSP